MATLQTKEEKLARLKNLRLEVKDFHPVLRVLFENMPGIKRVEYKQGPTEMGADFVLTKEDDLLGGDQYIGVIVKVGIIRQNDSEVERQIKECAIERKIQGGMKKIFLTEIWVVSNENITNNAQEKIHHSYKDRKISFVTGELLSSLLDKHYSEFWGNLSIEVNKYFKDLEITTKSIETNNLLLNTGQIDFYVNQNLKAINSSRYKKKGEKSKAPIINLDAIIKSDKMILIESDMGGGKSTLLAKTIRKYSNPEFYSVNNVLPVVITAKELLKDYNGDIECLVNKCKDYSAVSDKKDVIVFVDGLDEVKISADEKITLLDTINNKASERTKVIITSRFIYDPALTIEIEKNYRRYQLVPLTIGQVVTFVEKICDSLNIKNKLLKDLNKSTLLKSLPRTPISAILLAKLLNESSHELPSTMTDLYEKYMELSLGRWDMDKGLQSQAEYDTVFDSAINISQFMINNELNEISIEDAKEITKKYTDERDHLKVDLESVFSKLITKSDIISINEFKNTLSFRHRTFSEYFYSKGILRDRGAVIDKNIYEPFWSTVYFFYFGSIKDCKEMISAADEIRDSSNRFQVLKLINHGNFLLASYLTPSKDISKSTGVAFSQAALLYEDLIKNRTESPLSQLSPIHILCILTLILCGNYGYDFFLNALTNRVEEILTKTGEYEQRDYFELFFLNSTLMEIDKENNYDKMLEEVGKSLPVLVKLGIANHSEINDNMTPLAKKVLKKLRNNSKDSKSMKKYISDLYDKPVKENKNLIVG